MKSPNFAFLPNCRYRVDMCDEAHSLAYTSCQSHVFLLARYMWIPYTDAVVVVRCNPFEPHGKPRRQSPQVPSLKSSIRMQVPNQRRKSYPKCP